MSAYDILRRDYKQHTGTHSFGIAVVVGLSLRQFFAKVDSAMNRIYAYISRSVQHGAADAVALFMRASKVDTLLLMTAHSPPDYARQLCVYSTDNAIQRGLR
jgi:hypothetical protein